MSEKAKKVIHCGPSTVRCFCKCGTDEGCEHVWDGEWVETDEYGSESVTCSRCGLTRMTHDMWVMP